MRVSPENIQRLQPNEIFVFGSNLSGVHGAGAAKTAYRKFGAIWGDGVGLQGQSYAIPTKDSDIETLPIESIKAYVDQFAEFAAKNPSVVFLVTQIGCGYAGYSAKDIAPLFKECLNLINVYLPKSFINITANGEPND